MNLRQLCGWAHRPDETARLLRGKTFQTQAPHLSEIWTDGEEIFLWNATKKVNKRHLRAHRQTIGDCVSHGYGRGLDYLYCIKESAGLASGWDEPNTESMTEYVYGVSREAGNALAPWDGSNGIWAVNGLKRWGYIFRQGKAYNGQLAKQYGYRGVGSDLKSQGDDRILVDYAMIETPKDLANALKAGGPVPICSSQGFSMTRDSNGECRAQGRWDHCMVVTGLYRVNNRNKFVIEQSWGENTPNGPIPQAADFPDNGFGCDWDVMGRILAVRDSFALWGVEGFEAITQEEWIM